MVARSLVYVSLAALLMACESGAALGTTCTRASECSSPLVCRLGNCRTECVAARDCGPGQVCLINGAGEGACEIPAIDACSLSCDAPLICAAGRCRVECSVDGDCPDGHGCVTGACQRSDSTPDAGGGDAPMAACDPVGNTGCAVGRCGLGARAEPMCVASGGSAGLGAACTMEADCGEGFSCQGMRCVGVCRVADDPPSCGIDRVCSRDSVAHQSFIPGESPIGLCTEACVPMPDTGCPSDATCATGVGARGHFTWCRELGPDGEGVGCENDLSCQAGLRCYDLFCRAFCTVGGAACSGGYQCVGATELSGPTQYGSCVPPAP